MGLATRYAADTLAHDAVVFIGKCVAMWLKASELLCNKPTTIQIQFATCFRFVPFTKAKSVLDNRLYNSWLLLIDGPPLVVRQPNYAPSLE